MSVVPGDAIFRLGSAPGGVPLLGNALQIFKDPLTYLPALRQQGDLVKVRLGSSTAYMAVAHNVVQEVLRNPRVFDKGGEFIDKMRVILGDGVGTCSTTTHKRQRGFINPAFHPSKVATYTEVMAKYAAELADGWQPGQEVNFPDEMSKLTTKVTAEAMFSDDQVSADAIAEVQRSFPVVWKGVFRRMMLPLSFVRDVPTKANREFHQALQRLEDVISSQVVAYRKDSEQHDDILSILLSGRDELMTVLAAGVETPASGLVWSFYLLSQHPEVEAELHAEVDAVLAGRAATVDDYQSLPVANRIVNEALRMYPPVWFITRRAVEDTTLAGHRIPKDASILFSPYALHRDPEVFADPDSFVPDRWLPENLKKIPRNAVISFSGGTRKCIGEALANQEMTIAVATIAAKWRVLHKPGHQLKPVAKAELTAGTLPMILQPR